MTFPAKIHRASLILAAVLLTPTSIWATWILFTGDSTDKVFGGGILALVALVLTCTYPHRFIIEEGFLKTRMGLLTTKKVRLSDVTRVYLSKGWPPSHTMYPVSGWRLSTPKSEVLIIAEDEAAFFIELERLMPHLRRYGNELRGEEKRVEGRG